MTFSHRRIILVVVLSGLIGCQKARPVKAIRAVATGVESTVTTISSGTVSAMQQALLSFGITGRVAKIHSQLGDKVVEGQKIAELENSDLAVIWQDAQRDFKRTQKLFEAKLVSKSEWDQARKAQEVAKSNYEKSVIAAPFAGILTELKIEQGELAGPSQGGRGIVRLVDLKPRLVKGDIDEMDLGKVKVGQKARVRIPAAGPGVLEAEVSRAVPYVDTTKEQDRTSQVELTLKPTSDPVPVGASAEIEILVGQKADVLAVPTRAVTGSGESKSLFRIVDHVLRKTPVKTGMGNYDRVEILEGLKEGELVALPGNDVELAEGLKVREEVATWP